MAKRVSGPKKNGPGDEKKRGVLNLDPVDAQVVNLVASHRKMSVKQLFKEKDVKSFWEHLLRLELKKTSDQLGA